MIEDDIIQCRSQTERPRQVDSSDFGQRAARDMLLLCTTTDLSRRRKDLISRILAGPLDWKYFLTLSDLHGVTPLIAYNLTNSTMADQIPESYRKQLKHNYHNNLFRNVILSDELKKVLSVFNQHNIEAIVIKGTMLAEHLFGNPGLRTVGDMDIVVLPEKLSQASSLLLEMGYQQMIEPQQWEHPFHDAPYCKTSQFPLIIELHRNLDDERLVSFPQDVLWYRAQWLQVQESPVRMFSPEDNLVYLSDHLSKHATHLLRLLNDIAELLNKYNETLDWDYVLELADYCEIEPAVYYALKRSKELLGAPVPAFVINSLKPKTWRRRLLDFLVSNYFFISSTKLTKLRENTFTLARSLMMRSPHQTALVLTNDYHNKRGVWLRVIPLMILVLFAALGRNVARLATFNK